MPVLPLCGLGCLVGSQHAHVRAVISLTPPALAISKTRGNPCFDLKNAFGVGMNTTHLLQQRRIFSVLDHDYLGVAGTKEAPREQSWPSSPVQQHASGVRLRQGGCKGE